MKKVITYGTFDLFHHGHHNLLARAKELGDYLIVGVTSDQYDIERGKLNVQNNVLQRIESVRATGFADEIIVEEYEGQKIHDVQRLGVDVFAIGSDWVGQFDYLNEFCKVVYLERTQGVSSTMLRQKGGGQLRFGLVGATRSCGAFVREARFVSGAEAAGVLATNAKESRAFQEKYELDFAAESYRDLLSQVDAVFVDVPLSERYGVVREAIEVGKHVLCEAPIALQTSQMEELYQLADSLKVVLLPAVATAYSPGFMHLPALAKSGRIGEILAVDLTITAANSRSFGGAYDEPVAIEQLATYPLAAAAKLVGTEPKSISFDQEVSANGKLIARGTMSYSDSTVSIKVSPDVLMLADLTITGSRGYVYVPDPWWKTSYFEVRHKGQNDPRRYYYAFDGLGIRYELHELMRMVREAQYDSTLLSRKDTLFALSVIEAYHEANSHQNGEQA